MKKASFLTLAALTLAVSTVGCVGKNNGFALFNKIYDWNLTASDNEWVNEIIFLGLCIIPVYPICLFADTIVFNSIDFWTGENPIVGVDSNTGKHYAIVPNGVSLRPAAIEGTDIDYPVVRTPGDNEKYLRLGFDGAYATGGTLFLDERCDPGVEKVTANQMIYGHDMHDGTMFGKLHLYAGEEYGKEHSLIRFDTLHEVGEYQLLAAFYTQVYYTTDTCFKYYQFFDAENEEEFNDYVENVKALAEYDTGVSAEFGDTLLTLSTCSNHVENGRFVVVAKKVN